METMVHGLPARNVLKALVRLVTSSFAQVSVFDSSVQGGDAVWEGIRVYNGKVFCLDRCVRGTCSTFSTISLPRTGRYLGLRRAKVARSIGPAIFLRIVSMQIGVWFGFV